MNSKGVIPKSTLRNWNKRDIAKIIGCDSLADNDINLLRANSDQYALRTGTRSSALYPLTCII